MWMAGAMEPDVPFSHLIYFNFNPKVILVVRGALRLLYFDVERLGAFWRADKASVWNQLTNLAGLMLGSASNGRCDTVT